MVHSVHLDTGVVVTSSDENMVPVYLSFKDAESRKTFTRLEEVLRGIQRTLDVALNALNDLATRALDTDLHSIMRMGIEGSSDQARTNHDANLVIAKTLFVQAASRTVNIAESSNEADLAAPLTYDQAYNPHGGLAPEEDIIRMALEHHADKLIPTSDH